jgi:hypothetical protein
MSVRRLLFEMRWAALVGEEIESDIDETDEDEE